MGRRESRPYQQAVYSTLNHTQIRFSSELYYLPVGSSLLKNRSEDSMSGSHEMSAGF